MSKLDIGVGDEFPLDEGRGTRHGHRRGHRHADHHHHGHRGHAHHGHIHHRGRFGFGRFAILLVIAGLAALIVEHKLSADMAYGMIAAGAVLLVAMFAAHAMWHRRLHGQAS